MKKTRSFAVFALMISFAVFLSACARTAPEPPPRAKAETSPTPGYKPPKRVSRDVIRADNTAPVKVEAKAE